MAVYAIGDLQGCYEPLQRLLERLDFDPARDRLWFAGDLVNRGPASLQTLRFVKALGAAAVTVLGNHDLHLLAVASGVDDRRGNGDTLGSVLQAPDRDELIHWLRARPLLHHDAALGWAMLHAGLPPQWNLQQALALAGEVEAVLRGPDYRDALAHMYGNEPRRWDAGLRGWERLRFVINCLTRMRYCTAEGELCLEAKGPPGTQPPPCLPWFECPERRSAGTPLVCGHWSALGLYLGEDVCALDSGCLWGGTLTALRLDGAREVLSVECPGDATAAPED